MRSALRERFSKEWFAKEGVCASVLGVDGAVNWLLKQKECNDDDDRDVVATSDGVVDLGEIVVQTLSLEVDPYPGTGTASGEPVASYGDLDDSQPIIVDDSAYGDLDLS